MVDLQDEESKFSDLLLSIIDYVETHKKQLVYLFFLFIGAVLRIQAALKATGIVHPDEIFQSIEMAHYVVYGRAYIPAEFQMNNPFIESYAKARSYVFPLIFAAIMQFGEAFHLDYHTQTLVLIRLFLAFNSILLIPVVKKFSIALSGDEWTGIFAAAYVSIWFRAVEYTVRPFTNTFFLPMLFYGMYWGLRLINEDIIMNTRHHLAIIFGLGLSTYVRTDLGILVFAIVITTFNYNKLKLYLFMILDGMIGWILCAMVDFYYFEEWFVVPINWYTFNVKEQHSDLFGLYPPSFYLNALIFSDGLFLMSILMIALALYIGFRWNSVQITMIKRKQIVAYIELIGAIFISWMIISNVWRAEGSHKELRFAIGALILVIILMAHFTILVARIIYETVVYQEIAHQSLTTEEKIISVRLNKQWLRRSIIAFFLILILIVSIDGYSTRYHTETFDDVNNAMIYVGNQENVTGVIIISQWFLTGGNAYFHADAEIFWYSLRDSEYIGRSLTDHLANTTFNYLIIPYYELEAAGTLIEVAIDYGYSFDTVIQGRVEIWYR
ncbi:MAG: hypothetical protein INQ03_01260 [Candidatus Heimdallarchaeota archaeon]|nr:hypothetical protein [Candidatus Heimdallarchaeota archaeon]